MTLLRRGSAKGKHAARLAWLRANPHRIDGLPGIHDDMTPANEMRFARLCDDMYVLNLFGKTASVTLKRETVRRLISELRGERVTVGW